MSELYLDATLRDKLRQRIDRTHHPARMFAVLHAYAKAFADCDRCLQRIERIQNQR